MANSWRAQNITGWGGKHPELSACQHGFCSSQFPFNPILDNSYLGGFKNLDLAPAIRVAYRGSPTWIMAVEEYADIGPLSDFYSSGKQAHQMYGVVNHHSKWLDIEAGVGFGLTAASDKVTVKLSLSRDLR